MTNQEAKLLIRDKKSKHISCPGCGGVILYTICSVWKKDGEYMVVARCGGQDACLREHNCGWEEVFRENNNNFVLFS